MCLGNPALKIKMLHKKKKKRVNKICNLDLTWRLAGVGVYERFDSGELRSNFPVRKILYVGPFFSQVFQDHVLVHILDVVSFSTEPAYPP